MNQFQVNEVTRQKLAEAGPGEVVRVEPKAPASTELNRASLNRILGMVDGIRTTREIELADLERQRVLIENQIEKKQNEILVCDSRMRATRAAIRVLEDDGVN